jgi:hypothetical protein
MIFYQFPHEFRNNCGQTRAISIILLDEVLKTRHFNPSNFQEIQQSIIDGVGGRKTVLEKLFLAVIITFSLNQFMQVRIPEQSHTGTSYQQPTATQPEIVVTMPRK